MGGSRRNEFILERRKGKTAREPGGKRLQRFWELGVRIIARLIRKSMTARVREGRGTWGKERKSVREIMSSIEVSKKSVRGSKQS